MQIITQEQKAAMSFAEPVTRNKSQLRIDIESLDVNVSALFKEGEDYTNKSSLPSIVYAVRNKLNRRFELKSLADGTGAVVTRVA